MPFRHPKTLAITARSGSRIWCWINNDFLGLFREMRWSYLPPLMVYFAAGVSGFTGIKDPRPRGLALIHPAGQGDMVR
jgi:hypothetical protein